MLPTFIDLRVVLLIINLSLLCCIQAPTFLNLWWHLVCMHDMSRLRWCQGWYYGLGRLFSLSQRLFARQKEQNVVFELLFYWKCAEWVDSAFERGGAWLCHLRRVIKLLIRDYQIVSQVGLMWNSEQSEDVMPLCFISKDKLSLGERQRSICDNAIHSQDWLQCSILLHLHVQIHQIYIKPAFAFDLPRFPITWSCCLRE